MKLKIAAALCFSALALNANAITISTFGNNGGVHQDVEYAAGLLVKSATNIFSFSLASAADLFADAVVIGKTTGEVELFKEVGSVDTSLGSFSLDFGSKSFDSLAAGDYFYKVTATGKGGYLLESVMTPVPEPGSVAMLLAGLGVCGFVLTRKSRQ